MKRTMRRGSLGLTKVDDNTRKQVREHLAKTRNVPSPTRASVRKSRKQKKARFVQAQEEADKLTETADLDKIKVRNE